MKKLKNPSSIKLESATEFFVLCSRNDPLEVHGIMTPNPSDFRTAVGGSLRSKEGERGPLPSPSGMPQQKLTLGYQHPSHGGGRFALFLPVLELVEDVVDVVEDFCSHPLPSCGRYGRGTPSFPPGAWRWAGLAEIRGCCL